VGLPFTSDQFFAIFAEYNRAFVFVAATLWMATVAMLVFVSRDPERRSGALSLFLGALWLWNAAAYHAYLFARINPAAWLFAPVFATQALLFSRAAAARQPQYFSSPSLFRTLGVGLAVYALAYPYLTVALGHAYPAAPTYGVPCPTAILTIGLLMTARGGVPLSLAIIPVLWGFIGGSAAVLLAVPTDYVLLIAGGLLTLITLAQRLRPAPARR
jgi:hypothetical protein